MWRNRGQQRYIQRPTVEIPRRRSPSEPGGRVEVEEEEDKGRWGPRRTGRTHRVGTSPCLSGRAHQVQPTPPARWSGGGSGVCAAGGGGRLQSRRPEYTANPRSSPVARPGTSRAPLTPRECPAVAAWPRNPCAPLSSILRSRMRCHLGRGTGRGRQNRSNNRSIGLINDNQKLFSVMQIKIALEKIE